MDTRTMATVRRVSTRKSSKKIEVTPELKMLLRGLTENEAREYLQVLAITDELAKDSKLTEKDIMEIDEKIKKAIREKIEYEISHRYK